MANNRVEQDATEILLSLDRCLLEVLSQLDQRPLAAGLICQRSSFVAVFKQDQQVISPVVSWLDKRAEKKLGNYMDARTHIQKLTGLDINPHFSAGKMADLLQHHDRVRQAAVEKNLLFLPLAAFLSSKLCNNDRAEVCHDIASRTLLFDIHRQRWSDHLLQVFDIDKDCLPSLCPDFSPALKAHKLAQGYDHIPLSLIGGDQSFLCCNIPKKYRYRSLVINCGTGAFLQMPSKQDHSHTFSFSHVGSGSNQAFSILEISINQAASELDRIFLKSETSLDPSELQALFNKEQKSPFELKVFEKLQALLSAIHEKVLLFRQHRQNIDSIYISGGLANIDDFCQLLANISQLIVYRQAITEASALGAVRYLAAALHQSIEDCEDTALFSPQAQI